MLGMFHSGWTIILLLQWLMAHVHMPFGAWLLLNDMVFHNMADVCFYVCILTTCFLARRGTHALH